MNSNEKAEMLKSTITKLYSDEGRTFSYISRLLEIDRKIISSKVKEWNLHESKSHTYVKPSIRKFIDGNRELIKSRFDNDMSVTDIAKELRVDRKLIYVAIQYDDVIKHAHDDYVSRLSEAHNRLLESRKAESSYTYNIIDEEGELWKPILGYNGYMISNHGRVKLYVKTYNEYYLVKSYPNKYTGRLYVCLTDDKSIRKNISLSRLVALTFVKGHSDERNTVNHIDGNIINNHAVNLEWLSQSDNLKHAYRNLHRNIVNHKRYDFKEIVYKEHYHFKTVAAFAKFLGKSETQTRRYMDNPEKYDIEFIR